MSWEVFAKVLGSIAGAKSAFDPESSGGGGGGVSSKTQGGQGGIAFTPVGLETLEISPFDYMEMQRQFEQEQAEVEQMQYGGPLYLDMGGGIGDLFDPEILGNFEPEMPRAPAPEDFINNTAEMEKQNKRDFAFQTMGDIKEYSDSLAKFKKSPQDNTKKGVSGRGNIVPGSKGGMAYRRERQKTASQGITPFQYRAMQGGGALNRQMFAQNYMPNGGDIRGPGGPKDDLIPVMASNGEYMLSKAAVDQAGGGNHSKGIANLEQFNNVGNRRYGN
jgi:hypothetical protein